MRLNRLQNRSLCRPLDRYQVSRLDGRPARRPDCLAEICSVIARYLRQRKKIAQAEPHLFGRHASAYYRDTLQEEQHRRKIDTVLEKVYGPPSLGTPSPRSVWQERYDIPPDKIKFHRKWFCEKYGPG